MRLEEREPAVHERARVECSPEPGHGAPAAPSGSRSLRGLLARGRPSAGRRSRALINLVTLAVTALFCYIALSGVKFGPAWHALRTSDYLWLLPALVALALSLAARAQRWRVLFAPGRRPPYGSVFEAMMIGYLFNNIMPARAGEVARVVVLNKRSSAEPVEIIGTVVLERVFDVLGILVIFFVAEPWLPAVSWFRAAAIAAAVLTVLIATIALALATYGERAPRVLLRPLHRLPFVPSERMERTVQEVTNGLSALRYPGVALQGLLWTIVSWLLSAVLAYLVLLAFFPHLPFAAGVLVTVAVGLAMILPSPPAAVGVFEGAALIGLKAYGLSHTQALPYALVLHLVNFLPFIVVGVLLLQYNVRRPARLARGPAGGKASEPQRADPNGLPPAVDWNAAGMRGKPSATGQGSWHELPASQEPTLVQQQARNGAERLEAVDDGRPGTDRRSLL
jgi:uncharacterized protein (TIRG00374 family)